MARKPAPTKSRANKDAAKRLKAGALKDKQLREEIRQGLRDMKKSGLVPLRDVDRQRAARGDI